MTALTHRRDPQRPDCWSIFSDNVRMGTIVKSPGAPQHAEQWEWSCGLPPNSAAGFEAALKTLAKAWAVIEPKITAEAYAAHRHHRAFTAGRYAMFDAGLPMLRQSASGRSKCFWDAEIETGTVEAHVVTAHLGME